MIGITSTRTFAFLFFALTLFLQLSGPCRAERTSFTDEKTQAEIDAEVAEELQKEIDEKNEENPIPQNLGNILNSEKDEMDLCMFAAGPRPVNEVFSPGRTTFATVDDVNGGYCGVSIDSPGIWWMVEGTGKPITISSCHQQTEFKAKFSVFTGSCARLECVSGGSQPDYACPILRRDNELGEWNTNATAHTFESELDKKYYILVQGMEGERGEIWINFRHPEVPQNDQCVDAIGPVPRDLTRIENTNIDAEVDETFGTCEPQIPNLYPGTWFQIMGTGDPVTIMACGQYNFDGYAFSVYNGAYCDGMECVEGEYELGVEDPDKCTFGSRQVERKLTKYTFDTNDRDRYWIYVHSARTRADVPTADFRFYVDDGKNGDGSSTGAHTIGIIGVSREDAEQPPSSQNNKAKESSSTAVGFHRVVVGLVALLVASLL